MAVKNIVIWPNPVLKEVSTEVVDFGAELQTIIKDLKDSMFEEPIAGLAAPQIGVNKRLFVMDIPKEENNGNGTDGPEVFINPKVIASEGSFIWEEGCMSIPGYTGKVKRSKKIMMEYQNEHGQVIQREALDYLSGCFQHELDHLNGILWVDYQTVMKKNFIKKKMLSLQNSTN